MVEILPLTGLDSADVDRVIGEYISDACYRVRYADSEAGTTIQLELAPLIEPYVGKYAHFDEETLRQYNRACAQGYSFGAFQEGVLVGFLIAEAQQWNASLWVWEFHVAGGQRRQGIGRRLMERAAEKAVAAGLRIITCETQNRNAVAIAAYRRLGFRVEGIDISLYSNEDYPDRDVAVFMKRRLGQEDKK
jgi:ribosomal protein S18 acetylase RimI-like enzyme